MKHLILIVALTLSETAAASEIIIASDRGSVAVAVKIDRKADHVAIPLTVAAETGQPDERLEAITAAVASIRAAFAADPELAIEIGAISLSPSQSRRKSSSATHDSVRAFVQLYALGALTDQSDVFTQTRKVYRGLRELDLPRDVSINIGSTSLGVRAPESHRGQLLETIGAQIRSMKEALGASGKVTISGLEGAVRATQKNATDVSLYIDYRIVITTQ